MRDGLSLLDQAIAYGGGQVTVAEVQEMLGSIDRDRVLPLLQHLAEGNGEGLMAAVADLAEQSPDFAGVLAELNSLLQRLALAQQVPAALDDTLGDREALLSLASQMTPEQVQLYYQIGIIGRRDLPLAPDPRCGFEMVLLRMLAFRPASGGAVSPGSVPATQAGSATQAARAPGPHRGEQEQPVVQAQVKEEAPMMAAAADDSAVDTASPAEVAEPAMFEVAPGAAEGPIEGAPGWASLVAKLPLSGMTRQLAEHSALIRHQGDLIELALEPGCDHLRNPKWEAGLSQALEMYFGRKMRLQFDSAEPKATTPKQLREERQVARQEAAEAAVHSDQALQSIMDQFGGEIEPGSIRPRETE